MNSNSMYFNNLSLVPHSSVLLENADFSLGSAKITTFMGMSGCGKSSLGRYISTSNTLKQQRCGYMSQNDSLLPWRTVIQNIRLPFEAQNKKVPELEARELLKVFKLEDKANHYPHELSGGMKQRLMLLRTLIAPAEVYIFDEPFSQIDEPLTRNLASLVRKRLIQREVCAVFIIHNIMQAISISDTIYVFNNKKLTFVPVSLTESERVAASLGENKYVGNLYKKIISLMTS